MMKRKNRYVSYQKDNHDELNTDCMCFEVKKREESTLISAFLANVIWCMLLRQFNPFLEMKIFMCNCFLFIINHC